MPERSGLKVVVDQNFSCGQVVDEANLNQLNDAAVSALYRGDTVINQTGTRTAQADFPVLHGQSNESSITIYNQFELGWDFENAGYSKWLLRLNFKLDPLAYNPGGNIGAYTRLVVTHTDHDGITTEIWDTENFSYTRGSQQSATITGTFSNPPSSGETEIESLGLVCYSNHTTNETAFTSATWTGFLNCMFKLYDEV